MYWLVLGTFVLAIYAVLKIHLLGKGQLKIAEFLRERLKQEPEDSRRKEPGLAYGWFDDGWPVKKSPEEEIFPLENPALRITADSGECRSAFRTDVDHRSEVMSISVPN